MAEALIFLLQIGVPFAIGYGFGHMGADEDDKCSECGREDVCPECQIMEMEAWGKAVPTDLRAEAEAQRQSRQANTR